MARRRRLAAATAVVVAAGVLVAVLSGGGGGPPPAPPAGVLPPPRSADPFAYIPAREPAFVARATAGNSHVLFFKSPGGAVATAARVARWDGLIRAATSGTSVDPRALEAIVFLESAGYPNAIAGGDPAGAAGLTQIVASTGTALLGMRIDLARTRALTAAIFSAGARGQAARVARLEAQRARIDDRFNPRRELAATVHYLELARRRFGRGDLAIESYHMGIGNLGSVLAAYGHGTGVPYVQLYFDTSPDHNPAAYALLSSFGDDSWTYYWRILAAEQIMSLYRSDRAGLVRLAGLQTASDSAAEVLHPPDRSLQLADPDGLAGAYAQRLLLPLPRNTHSLGVAYDPRIGSLARRVGGTPGLYRGLRPAALDLLVELAARVRALSGGAAPLIVTSAVLDRRYQQRLGIDDPPAAGGWSFTLARRYVNDRQRGALQAMLDRLEALNLIAWQRYPSQIEVTVASDASAVIASGP